MKESSESHLQGSDPFKPAADMLFAYLRDVVYRPASAELDIGQLPEAFRDFGRGLQYMAGIVSEIRNFARELAEGNLNCTPPTSANEIASSLKMLQSSLRHLTWQTQQVAKGNYTQRVNFMGDFSIAFNNMIEQLEQRQKSIQDEKQQLEMYMRLILVNCPNPILLFDRQGKLAYASDSYFQFCHGCTRDDIMGKQIHDLLLPVVSGQALDEIEHLYRDAILEERMFRTIQEMNFGAPESSGYFEIQITPMPDADGNTLGIIMFLYDITESIQARQSAEEARDMAEEASRSKTGFIAKMSHEIRTPMNAILGMAELALREDVSAVAEEHIHTIKQAGTNLLSIINDILDYSKIEVGRMEIVPAEYLFSSLVNDVINIIKARLLESRLRFVVNIDSNIPNMLFGDAIRIRQVLLNLLSNAVKYTERGFVSFSVRGEMTDDKTVILVADISDSGKGMKPDEMERLFGEYTRFDAQGNKGIEGTGLGLAICKSLVSAMNGSIDVKSEYGKGSSFIVLLPQRVFGTEKLAVVENPGEKNVIVYERRELFANSIIHTMKNLGINCKLVSTGTELLNSLAGNNYSFVFLPSVLYDDVKKKNPDFKTDARFAVIAEFGEAITDRNISTLTMPIFCIPVASFLNGVSDSYAGRAGKGTTVNFIAPEAKVLVVDDVNTNLIVAGGLLQPYKMQVKLCKSGIEALKEIKSTRYDLVLLDNMMPEMDGVETL
ncbi:MAG: ATP-binding protein, partial [Treponema sp.]|nr:ATP-binding protein [Treponema sp.]